MCVLNECQITHRPILPRREWRGPNPTQPNRSLNRNMIRIITEIYRLKVSSVTQGATFPPKFVNIGLVVFA